MDFLTANDRPGVYPDSYYAASAKALAPFPSLKGEASADVCIIGAGYTGLSAALHCAARGLSVVLLDAQRVGWGASGRNGGQVGADQRVDQKMLETQFGYAHARRLFDLGLASAALVKSLVSKHEIDCHLKPGILYVDHKDRFADESRSEVEHLNQKYGYEGLTFVERDELSKMLGTNRYASATLNRDAAHLHPLSYAFGLAKAAVRAGAEIFECSRVTSISYGPIVRIETADGSLRAGKVLLACNGYLGALDRHVAARVMPINNFIIATEPLTEEVATNLIRDDVAVADSKFVVNYWRLSEDRRLLFGGRETYSYRFPQDIKQFVRKPMLQIYPQLEDVQIDFGWGGTLGITRSRLPHFVRLAPNVLSASGYSGHGVALATLAGKLAAASFSGEQGDFDEFASIPTPLFPGGRHLRSPLLALGMLFYGLRDRF